MKNNFFNTMSLGLKSSYIKIKKQNTSITIGYILLIPPLFGILSFVIDIVYFNDEISKTIISGDINIKFFWWGVTNKPSQFPLYFGLMALAGAYLIKDDKK